MSMSIENSRAFALSIPIPPVRPSPPPKLDQIDKLAQVANSFAEAANNPAIDQKLRDKYINYSDFYFGLAMLATGEYE